VGFLAQGEPFKRLLDRVGIAPESCWHFGFALAAFGMFLGLVQYVRSGKRLGDAGRDPVVESEAQFARLKRRLMMGAGVAAVVIATVAALVWSGVFTIAAEQVSGLLGILLVATTIAFFAWLFLSRGWTPQERKRLVVIAVLFVTSAVFWSAFEQAGSSLNLFAQNQTDSSVLGIPFPPSWFQSVNSFFIICLAPVFAWLWVWLGKNEPTTTTKFSLGLVGVGAGFAVMFVAANLAASGVKVSPMWLVVTYLLHTMGELALSPVGLSAMTKLAPARVAGMMMGVWFLSLAMGGYIAGGVVTLYESLTRAQIFAAVTVFAVAAGVILALFIRPITRLERAR
jgi:POT family proton-dependent oligopeptide transporter